MGSSVLVMRLIIILIFSLVTISQCRQVTTLLGPVEGDTVVTVDSRTNETISYEEFLMIPFAEPPLGQNRFAPPKPAKPWTVFNTPVPKDRICYQAANGIGLAPGGDEDCLYLNVFVPSGETEPMPVLIWYTGGAFVFGGASWYGPNFWMGHKIIIVVVNYRLGPLGFLTLGTDSAPGNMGLLDQRMAMEWVRDNIEVFGGDPGQVTIAGESAGSFSTFYHLLSPGSRGLFSRVIGQSGVGGLSPAFHHWTPEQGIRLGNEVSALVGCIQLTVEARLDCLKQVSALALSIVEFEDGVISQPVVDRTYATDPFLPNYPAQAYMLGDFNHDVDVLLGANNNEGYLLTQAFLGLNQTLLPFFMGNWDIWGPIILLQKHYLETTDEDREIAFSILEHYCGTRNVTMEHLTSMTDMFTDAFFWVGVDKYIDYHLQHSDRKVFHYINHHINDVEQLSIFGVPLPGVSHGDELFLQWDPFFGSGLFSETKPWSEEDRQTSLHLTSLWSNFVKYGDPTPPGEDMIWEPVVEEDKRFLKLSSSISMESRPTDYIERISFWRQLFP